jgi:hypothetical protein
VCLEGLSLEIVPQIEPEIEPEKAVANPFGGGMDWLEVRLPLTVPFAKRTQEVIDYCRNNPAEKDVQSAMRDGDHYAKVIDLRKFDTAEGFLHLSKKHGDSNHKLQLVGSGQHGWAQHIGEIEAVVNTEPLELQPMRTDLTVDVDNVPMSFVLEHARVAGKRFSAQYHDVNQYLVMGMRELQTAYSGKKPNCFRVYDKKTERMQAYRAMTRGWHPREPKWREWLAREWPLYRANCTDFFRSKRGDGASTTSDHEGELRKLFTRFYEAWEDRVKEIGPKPTFKEFCGLDENQVLTRFERQIGAQQVGKLYHVGDETKHPIFTTLRDLKRNVADFNPFAAMSFAKAGAVQPEPPNGLSKARGGNYSLTTYMAGMYLRQRILNEGLQPAIAWATPLANGHMKELLENLAPFMPPQAEGAHDITGAELYERYRTAITKQLAA